MKPVLSDEELAVVSAGLQKLLPDKVGFALIVFPKSGPDQDGSNGPNTKMTAGFTSNVDMTRALIVVAKMGDSVKKLLPVNVLLENKL